VCLELICEEENCIVGYCDIISHTNQRNHVHCAKCRCLQNIRIFSFSAKILGQEIVKFSDQFMRQEIMRYFLTKSIFTMWRKIIFLVEGIFCYHFDLIYCQKKGLVTAKFSVGYINMTIFFYRRTPSKSMNINMSSQGYDKTIVSKRWKDWENFDSKLDHHRL